MTSQIDFATPADMIYLESDLKERLLYWRASGFTKLKEDLYESSHLTPFLTISLVRNINRDALFWHIDIDLLKRVDYSVLISDIDLKKWMSLCGDQSSFIHKYIKSIKEKNNNVVNKMNTNKLYTRTTETHNVIQMYEFTLLYSKVTGRTAIFSTIDERTYWLGEHIVADVLPNLKYSTVYDFCVSLDRKRLSGKLNLPQYY